MCLYEEDIENISRIIQNEFEVISITDKISKVEETEDSFGYKGLHLDLKLKQPRSRMPEYINYSNFCFEMQIRTVVQDSWSIIDHKIKYKKSIPGRLKRRINTLAALFELADREFCAIRDGTNVEIEKSKQPYQVIDDESSSEHSNVKKKSKIQYSVSEPLNAFNFLRIANHFFPDFDFEAHKVDGFTQQIASCEPGITRARLNFHLRENIALIKRYQIFFENSEKIGLMNPYTIMRHCLYASDSEVYTAMLTAKAKANFENWRANQ